MLGKNTILKAIHNGFQIQIDGLGVWMLGKNTILKAIHNPIAIYMSLSHGVNAG